MTSTRARRLLLVPIVLAVFGGAGAVGIPPAQADIAADIRAGQARLDQLNLQAEAAAERYDAGRIALAHAQERASVASAALARDDAAVRALRVQADRFAAKVYRDGGTGLDVAVLSSRSAPATLLDRMSTLDQLAQHQSDVLTELATARHRQDAAAVEAQAALAVTQATVAGLAADKRSVQAAASQAQQVLAGLQAKQAELIQAARDAAARAAAEARAAELAAQARENALALARFAAQQISVPPPPTQFRHYSGSAANIAVQAAEDQLGKPYVWGASGPDSFDCSGLTMYAYAQAGISLPHYTGDQYNAGRHVSRSELQPGDLVFFEQSIGHVGIYIGGNRFVHAPHSGDVVKISELTGWYNDQYQGAVRIAG